MAQVSDTKAPDALVHTLEGAGYRVRHLAVYDFEIRSAKPFIRTCREEHSPSLVLNLHGLAAQDNNPLDGLPVMQLVQASNDRLAWANGAGLSPADIASKVALPELDGRILSSVVSFRALDSRDPNLQCQLQHRGT